MHLLIKQATAAIINSNTIAATTTITMKLVESIPKISSSSESSDVEFPLDSPLPDPPFPDPPTNPPFN